jgi:hypothetical protein
MFRAPGRNAKTSASGKGGNNRTQLDDAIMPDGISKMVRA